MNTTDRLPRDLQIELDALAGMPDADIDTVDIPEVTDWAGSTRGALYWPVKKQVTIRLDADVLAWFQAQEERGYQTRINAALREDIIRHSG